jgi:DNA-binding response OmpR family regulator
VIRLLETILVVEDHDDSRRMLEDVLTLAGFRVLAAHNGAEALRALGQEPHLVVLNLVLPWISGIEVLSTIRETPHLAAVPVLIVTATGTSEYELRNFGPIALMRKPLNVEAIVPTVHRLLSQSYQRS